MTDERLPSTGDRLDLRALNAAPDPTRREEIIAAVMARISHHPPAAHVIVPLARACRRMAAVAAGLVLLAAGAVLTVPRQGLRPEDEEPISSWLARDHVPTNGELLAVFHGYTP